MVDWPRPRIARHLRTLHVAHNNSPADTVGGVTTNSVIRAVAISRDEIAMNANVSSLRYAMASNVDVASAFLQTTWISVAHGVVVNVRVKIDSHLEMLMDLR
jgi:hypothetical protein